MNQLKNMVMVAVTSFVLLSCNDELQKGKFTVSGELKNAPDQQVYLEELYFSQKDPTVLDTGEIKNGKFSVHALAPEQGLYRLRLEKSQAPLIFINDRAEIGFHSDYNSLSLESAQFNSPANQLLRKFMLQVDARRKELESKSSVLQQYEDSLKRTVLTRCS
jgi:hypothetical protein